MDAKRAGNRDIYARLSHYLRANATADAQTLFLNWGYEAVDGAPDWLPAGTPPPRGVNAAHIRLLLELVSDTPLDGRSVLDIGCGRGGVLKTIAERFSPKKLTGLDISPDNIAFCQRHLALRKARFQVADACQLPLGDASVDVVVNLESSGSYPDFAGFLTEVARVLKPGGAFLFGDVLPAEWLPELRTALPGIGLALVRERCVSVNVLGARAKAAAVEARLFEQGKLRESDADGRLAHFMEVYRASDGSAINTLMRDGALTYRLFQFAREPAATASAMPDERAARLNSRDAMFDALLAGHCAPAPASQDGGDRWFPFGLPGGAAKLTVFALPHAGGGASAYREWAGAFGPDIQFCPLQLPGREHRIAEPPFTKIGAMADACLGAISPYWDRPFVLMGHSLGARVAFEMAVRLPNLTGARFVGLIASACPAPDIPTGMRASTLPAKALGEQLRRLGGTAEEILRDGAAFAAHEPAIRADFGIGESYFRDDRVRIAVPALTIAASDDGHVGAAAVHGWERFTTGPVRHETVAGGHFFLKGEGSEEARSACRDFLRTLMAPAAKPSPNGNVSATWLPLRTGRTNAPLRLFCLAFAGGSASYFQPWLREMPAAIDVCPIELPGRGTRFFDPPATGAEALIADMAAAIRPHLDRPFALFGHSLGALNAYLLARHLWQQGNVPPVHLFVSGRRAPHRPVRQPFRHVMDDAALIGELQGLGGMTPEILQSEEMLRMVLPVLRADFRITELYSHREGPGLPFPITAFTGDHDGEVPPEEMEHWRHLAGAGFALNVLAGGHFYLSAAQERRALLQKISAALAVAMAA